MTTRLDPLRSAPPRASTGRRLSIAWVALALSCVAAPACAGASIATSPQVIVASVDDDVVTRAGLDALTRYARLEDPSLDSDRVLDALIEGRLLARYCAATFTSSQLFPEQRVGFAPDVVVDDRVAALLDVLYHDELAGALRARYGASLERAIVATAPITPHALEAVLGPPAKLRVAFELDAAQRQRARSMIVLAYALPDGTSGRLDLDDMYRRQNVQGRMTLHELDVGFLVAQARQRLAAILVVEWGKRRLGAGVIAELERALDDREMVRALRAHYGIGADIHDASPYVSVLRAAVTPADVDAWYVSHRDDFRYTARVKARHVRVGDERTADRVADEIDADGANFADVARRHSIAPDARSGGDLGWIARRPDNDWFTELVFAQTPGKTGAPVRSAVDARTAATFEIVRVDAVELAYFARDSETVRYLASRAIAEGRARAAYDTLRATLRNAATIRRRPALPIATPAP